MWNGCLYRWQNLRSGKQHVLLATMPSARTYFESWSGDGTCNLYSWMLVR